MSPAATPGEHRCCMTHTNDKYMGFRVFSTKERAVEALNVLKRMLDMGADVNALDSYGNSGMNRFALQAKQILPSYNYVEHCEGTEAPNLGYSVRKFCSEGSISILFDEVFG